MNITVTFSCKQLYRRGRKGENFLNHAFTLAISVNDNLFGTTVVLEKRRKFGEFLCLIKGVHLVISLQMNYINEKNGKCFDLKARICEEWNIIDFINAPYIKLHSLTL